MRQITKNIYSFEELSTEAKEKAIEYFRENEDYPFLKEDLEMQLEDLLKENGIKATEAKLYYSLSNCQGDGLMFEGVFQWKNHQIEAKHSGFYCHSYSKTLEITNEEGEEANEKTEKEFEEIYQSICEELEKNGYSIIENALLDETIKENILANEYKFFENGEYFINFY